MTLARSQARCLAVLLVRGLVTGVMTGASVLAQETTRVSVSSEGAEAINGANAAILSADGRFVVLASGASPGR
jgi:hypothetical protein